MEKAVTERLGYLQRQKEMMSFQIARFKHKKQCTHVKHFHSSTSTYRFYECNYNINCSLQRQLDESVPVSDLENSTLKFQELTEKYRDLLERSNSMVAQAERESGFEVCLRLSVFDWLTIVTSCCV